MKLFLGRRVRWSLFVVGLSLAGSVAPTYAEGWKFWEQKETAKEDGLGGTPYASSAKQNRSSGYQAPRSSSDSGAGWNIGAGMSNTGKAVVNGATSMMSKTASTTKKVAKKTVDIVTLKPLWASKPATSNEFQLGSHPDPRSQKSKPAMWGASTTTKSEPRTVGQFFSQKQVR